MFVAPGRALFTGWSRPPGLQAEGLFYRNPGPPVSHGGRLLEDGVGVEVSFNRYAHRTQRAGAGTVPPLQQECWPESRAAAIIVLCHRLYFKSRFSSMCVCLRVCVESFLTFFFFLLVFAKYQNTKKKCSINQHSCSLIGFPSHRSWPGKVFPVLAIRGQCYIWRLHGGADWRLAVRHLHSQRHDAHQQTSTLLLSFQLIVKNNYKCVIIILLQPYVFFYCVF